MTYASTNGALATLNKVFTGVQITPYLSTITMGDSTVLNYQDFRSYSVYGTNIAAKTNGGTVTRFLKYDESDDSYPYGGNVTFKFNIVDHEKISL